MKTLQIVAVLVMYFSLVALIFIKVDRKEIKHSDESIILYYQHGYYQGQLNELRCTTTIESEVQWKKDSTEFVRRFVK